MADTHQQSQHERRRFSRVLLDWPVFLRTIDQETSAQLVDLSFRGALVHNAGATLAPGTPVQLHIQIPQSQLDLQFDSHVVRMDQAICALSIDAMDIESMSELRRVIELNLGDNTLLQREMEQLLPAP